VMPAATTSATAANQTWIILERVMLFHIAFTAVAFLYSWTQSADASPPDAVRLQLGLA
jgi:hypothetical protein